MKITFFIFFVFSFNFLTCQIIIDDQRTAQELVDVLVGNIGCATISNFSVSGGDFSSGENSFAYFNRGTVEFPFEDGIVLSTGNTTEITNLNADVLSGEIDTWTGLGNTIENILGVSSTFNATTLEFDFTPQLDFMSFEYIFASEEYTPEYMCQFSDVFGFLIKEVDQPDSEYINIALIPNTTTAVKVTTVHPDNSPECLAINEEFFDFFNAENYPTPFDGQTTTFTASSSVVPGVTYHMKLIIADDIDNQFDSAVFLKGGSFDIGSFLGEDRLINNGNALCEDDTFDLDAGIADSYQWSKFNELTLVFDDIHTNQVLTVTPSLGSGTYRVIISQGSGCVFEDTVIIEYDNIQALNDAVLETCIDNNSENGEFNLFNAFDQITTNNTLIIENFYLNILDAENEVNAIPSPINYVNISQGQEIFVQVKTLSGCTGIAKVRLIVYQIPEILPDETVVNCINITSEKPNLESGFVNGNVSDYTFQWFFNGNEITCSTAQSETLECVDIDGMYSVEITNVSNPCSAIRNFDVLTSSAAIYDQVLVTEDKLFPDNLSIIISVLGEGDYEFAIDIDPLTIDNDENYQDSNTFEKIVYGTHLLYIRDKNGCGITIKEIHLLKYPQFFTPNTDGVNDRWNINHINTTSAHFNASSNITIFNRYGKVMAVINPKGNGWDGNYKGEPVAQTTYWFTVNLVDYNGNIFTKKGRFSLER